VTGRLLLLVALALAGCARHVVVPRDQAANLADRQWTIVSEPVAAAATERAPDRSITERLQELDLLHAEGLVSKSEYEERRNAILGDL